MVDKSAYESTVMSKSQPNDEQTVAHSSILEAITSYDRVTRVSQEQGMSAGQLAFIEKMTKKYSSQVKKDKTDFQVELVKTFLAYVPAKYLTRTSLCKHKESHTCVENALTGFCRTFTNVLFIKVAINSLFYIGNF